VWRLRVYGIAIAHDRRQGALLALGAAGPVVFVAGYLVNGARQPGYSSWHHTISTLSLARHGWVQDANFVLYGTSTLCFVEGLRRSDAGNASGFGMLGIAGLGLIVVGGFRSDPILGFPVDEPAVETARGTVHNIASLIVFLAFPGAVLVTTGRPFRRWEALSIVSGVLSFTSIAAFSATVAAADVSDGGNSPAGLFERLPTLFIGLWQVAFVVRVLSGRPAIRR